VEEREYEEALSLLDQVRDLPHDEKARDARSLTPTERPRPIHAYPLCPPTRPHAVLSLTHSLTHSLSHVVPVSVVQNKRLYAIRRAFAYSLFQRRSYDRAMSLFQELNADPAEVVALFPSLVPEDLRAQFKYPINMTRLGTYDACCVCMHVCTPLCVYVCVCVCMYVRTYVCVCAVREVAAVHKESGYAPRHAHVRLHKQALGPSSPWPPSAILTAPCCRPTSHTHTHTHTHAHTHAHTHTRTHTRTHTHTYTHNTTITLSLCLCVCRRAGTRQGATRADKVLDGPACHAHQAV
jgi:hypothetical protein